MVLTKQELSQANNRNIFSNMDLALGRKCRKTMCFSAFVQFAALDSSIPYLVQSRCASTCASWVEDSRFNILCQLFLRFFKSVLRAMQEVLACARAS